MLAGVVLALTTATGTAVAVGAAVSSASSTSTSMPDSASARSADEVMRSAIDDVQAYWTSELPKVYGAQYVPIPASRLDAYTSTDWPAACGTTGTTPYEDVENNAFYCSTDDFLAWDSEKLIPTLRARFGDFGVALVAAHELGHAVQARTGTSASSTIPLELQADCFAGAWAKHATKTKGDTYNVTKSDLEEALSGYLSFRDATGTDPRTEGAHGSAFDRIGAFSDGFTGGASRCKDYDTDPPAVTEIPFVSGSDAANQGNLPFADLVTAAKRDLDAYWTESLGRTPVTSVVASAKKRQQCAKGDTRPVVACGDGVVAYDPAALEAAYGKYGDYAAATLMAKAWGDAAQRDGSVNVRNAPRQRVGECLAGAWAAAMVNGTARTTDTLSPGDLDEAVSAMIEYPGPTTPGNSAFVRYQAFRHGFEHGASTCGLKTKTKTSNATDA